MSKSPSSKADTLVKLVLIFFISLLSFSVGTYVGKQVSESEAKQAALEADYNSHDNHEEATVADEATEPISDEETASLAEEFVNAERKVASEETGHGDAHGAKHAEEGHGEKVAAAEHGDGGHGDTSYTHRSKMNAKNHEEAVAAMEESHGSGHGEQAAHHETPERHAAAEHAPAKIEKPAHGKMTGHNDEGHAATRVAHDMAPAADPKKVKPAPTTLPTVATTAIGKYTVQVASYATETEAKEQATKLTTKGYSAFYVPAEVNGKTWYRVSVGLFADQKSATNYRTELLATQAVSSAIVQKIVK